MEYTLCVKAEQTWSSICWDLAQTKEKPQIDRQDDSSLSPKQSFRIKTCKFFIRKGQQIALNSLYKISDRIHHLLCCFFILRSETSQQNVIVIKGKDVIVYVWSHNL